MAPSLPQPSSSSPAIAKTLLQPLPPYSADISITLPPPDDDFNEAQLLQEPPSLLIRRLKAMTWASRAKDQQLLLLHSRLSSAETEASSLRSALLAARVAEERLAADIAEIEAEAMHRALETGRQLARLEARLAEWERMKRRVEMAEEAEERMAREMAELEAEAMKEAMESRSVIEALREELKGRGAAVEEKEEEVVAQKAEGTALVASLQSICERLLKGQKSSCPGKRRLSSVKAVDDSTASLQAICEKVLMGQTWASCPDNKPISVKGADDDELGLRLNLWKPSSLVLQARS